MAFLILPVLLLGLKWGPFVSCVVGEGKHILALSERAKKVSTCEQLESGVYFASSGYWGWGLQVSRMVPSGSGRLLCSCVFSERAPPAWLPACWFLLSVGDRKESEWGQKHLGGGHRRGREK